MNRQNDTSRPLEHPEGNEKEGTGDNLHFANRLRMQKNPPRRILVQGKRLGRASFDTLSLPSCLAPSGGKEESEAGIPVRASSTEHSRRIILPIAWQLCAEIFIFVPTHQKNHQL